MESAREVPIDSIGFVSQAQSRDPLAPVRPVRQ